ncbi:ESPR domain-containing protein [Caballeronia sp. M23-90]
MNRIFKAVWNESSGTWVAASETSKSHSKRNLFHRSTDKYLSNC